MTDEFVIGFWSLLIVTIFLLLLIVPAAFVESRWGRRWIERLNRIEMGRIHQEAMWLEEGSKYSGDKR